MNEKISDEKLYLLCKRFGTQVLEARRKFLGLLPEVNKRELAERKVGRSWLGQHGFSSLFEFAAKLAGVSEEQVRLVLNLKRKFDDKPELQKLLIGGDVSVNKLARLASIATVENQAELADKVKVLPKIALDCLVRDEKNRMGESDANIMCGDGGEINGVAGGMFGLPVHSKMSGIDRDVKLMAALSEGLKSRLFELNQKGIDVDRLLLEFLDERVREIEVSKENLGREAYGRSRYISVKIRKVLSEEFGSKCAIAGCGNPAENLHHTNRFSV